ncbi:MAG: hypothetical protein L0H73_06795 [Nitrococcus sp.]|nr:hypothetical protein [Nitrococcus sp.]
MCQEEIEKGADSAAEVQTPTEEYRSPQLYELGSLKSVQSYYEGNDYDGPESAYWYI